MISEWKIKTFTKFYDYLEELKSGINSGIDFGFKLDENTIKNFLVREISRR